jgi:hypothetical protein
MQLSKLNIFSETLCSPTWGEQAYTYIVNPGKDMGCLG